MLHNMKTFITAQQKTESEHLQDTRRNTRICNRIKAFFMVSEDWNSVMITEALSLHQATADDPIHDSACYYHPQRVKKWAEAANNKFHFLLLYSQNLNLRAKMWKLINEHFRNSHLRI
ncbi:hypothetical protein [Escherichia sp. E4702]|uniref:hypothetical protein n=1 Tax=Escherichia sp. E4702 TaxID=2044465 RepID=UPI001104F931|nr:hypothetical protein [Escherichia sp. E4702]TGB79548.1 hypothetical protein CRI67_01850 [Escherichia sp. E4702]